VIEAVFAQGPCPQTLDGLGRVVDLQMEDLDDVDKAAQSLGLSIVPRKPVQNQDMLFGDDQLLHFEDIEVAFEDTYRQVVGYESTLRRVLFDLTAEFAVSGNFTENISHRDMDPVGKLTEHGPLGPFAATGHSKQYDRAIAMTFFHDLIPLTRVARPENHRNY